MNPELILKAMIEPVKTVELVLPEFDQHRVSVVVMRLDQVHPVISGNKWFKLKFYLQEALTGNKDLLVTWGGAYSNHILATACAAHMIGLQSAGIIRGEMPTNLSPTLESAKAYGMNLRFISRTEYEHKADLASLKNLADEFPNACFIPEGGAGIAGIRGAETILQDIEIEKYSHILCAVGTGTMFTGLANGSLPLQQVWGISVLKGIRNPLNQLRDGLSLPEKIQDCRIFEKYHFGGYAKKNSTLIHFMNQFYGRTGIPTDFVYTAKMFFGMMDLINDGELPPGSRLLVIHSGGLQGNSSLPKETLLF